MATADEQAEKEFAAQDKEWTGPKFFATGIVTLVSRHGEVHVDAVAGRGSRRCLRRWCGDRRDDGENPLCRL